MENTFSSVLAFHCFPQPLEGVGAAEKSKKRQSKTTSHVFRHFPKEKQENADVLRLSLTQIPRFCTKKLFSALSYFLLFFCSFSTAPFYFTLNSPHFTPSIREKRAKGFETRFKRGSFCTLSFTNRITEAVGETGKFTLALLIVFQSETDVRLLNFN